MKKQLLVLLGLGIFWFLPLTAAEETAAETAIETVNFQEGTHYEALTVPLRTRYPDKIEVTEYFSYGCPHCYQFDPIIEGWKAKLPNDVVFNRTPAIWNPDYQVYAQTYYTAEALKVLEKIHEPLFQAIHVERKLLNDPKSMAYFFNRFGIDPLDFANVYKSFGVRASVQQAEARGRAYRATGVPTIIVNGKYRIEGKHAGGNTNMLVIAEYLIEEERQAMKNPSQ